MTFLVEREKDGEVIQYEMEGEGVLDLIKHLEFPLEELSGIIEKGKESMPTFNVEVVEG